MEMVRVSKVLREDRHLLDSSVLDAKTIVGETDGLKNIRFKIGMIYEVNSRSSIILIDDSLFSDNILFDRVTLFDCFIPNELTEQYKDYFEEVGIYTYLTVKVDKELASPESLEEDGVYSNIQIRWKDESQKSNFFRILRAKRNPQYMM